IAMKIIASQAKQLALLLLILVLDHHVQANATSYKSHFGNVLSSRSRMLRSQARTLSAPKLEEPQSDIFSSPPLLSVRVRRSLGKKIRSPPSPLLPSLRKRIPKCKKCRNRSPPQAPKPGRTIRQRSPPSRYRPPPPPPPPPRPRPWVFPFFCSPPPPPPSLPPPPVIY
ncbi:hypothetical protein Tco_0118008, partial [Tanacetum coccineum]